MDHVRRLRAATVVASLLKVEFSARFLVLSTSKLLSEIPLDNFKNRACEDGDTESDMRKPRIVPAFCVSRFTVASFRSSVGRHALV